MADCSWVGSAPVCLTEVSMRVEVLSNHARPQNLYQTYYVVLGRHTDGYSRFRMWVWSGMLWQLEDPSISCTCKRYPVTLYIPRTKGDPLTHHHYQASPMTKSQPTPSPIYTPMSCVLTNDVVSILFSIIPI